MKSEEEKRVSEATAMRDAMVGAGQPPGRSPLQKTTGSAGQKPGSGGREGGGHGDSDHLDHTDHLWHGDDTHDDSYFDTIHIDGYTDHSDHDDQPIPPPYNDHDDHADQ